MAKKLDQGCGIPPRSHTFLGKLFGMLSRPGWLTSSLQPGQARDQGAGGQRRELPPLNGLPACTTAAPDGIIANKFLKALECSLALAMLGAVDRQGLEMDVRCNLH